MSLTYSYQQLDALRELANIGSGTAGTALSGLLGRSVEISIPTAAPLQLADAVDDAGDPRTLVRAVLLPVTGDLEATILLLFPPADAARLCGLLDVEAGTPEAQSALGEIGNILGSSYIIALSQMTGLELEPRPPQTVTDLLGAVVADALLLQEQPDVVLVLDSVLAVEGEPCSLTFLMLPTPGGVEEILARVGL